MNELNLKDIRKETTKGPTKVMAAIAQYQGCLQNLANLYHYKVVCLQLRLASY